ncbi:hypothetical protein DERP_004698 [Dermatophagoides pteronyssinus]|uniref:Uncharacterized protein n=1 Tax=Dermatophagoides pteronyssinus TaxID=6956 RepID=A0ABQ8JPH3_DERPT|nr:hypothetical protein DERP_004698 [Dermatophagoides pteronyssinus]
MLVNVFELTSPPCKCNNDDGDIELPILAIIFASNDDVNESKSLSGKTILLTLIDDDDPFNESINGDERFKWLFPPI